MGENKLLEAALKYATKYGWAVFPCSQKTKKPLTPHGCKDAKKTAGPIKAWWKKYPDASIGVATGSISNLMVIDLDAQVAESFHDKISDGMVVLPVNLRYGSGGNCIELVHESDNIGFLLCPGTIIFCCFWNGFGGGLC